MKVNKQLSFFNDDNNSNRANTPTTQMPGYAHSLANFHVVNNNDEIKIFIEAATGTGGIAGAKVTLESTDNNFEVKVKEIVIN